MPGHGARWQGDKVAGEWDGEGLKEERAYGVGLDK